MILRSSIDFCLFKASAADGLPLLRRLWQACHPGECKFAVCCEVINA